MPKIFKFIIAIMCLCGFSIKAQAFTANAVWFEFHPGFFRVIVKYTIPELKEKREAYVDFNKKREAEKFYFSLLRGGDFSLGDPKKVEFTNPSGQPDPW